MFERKPFIFEEIGNLTLGWHMHLPDQILLATLPSYKPTVEAYTLANYSAIKVIQFLCTICPYTEINCEGCTPEEATLEIENANEVEEMYEQLLNFQDSMELVRNIYLPKVGPTWVSLNEYQSLIEKELKT